MSVVRHITEWWLVRPRAVTSHEDAPNHFINFPDPNSCICPSLHLRARPAEC